MVKINLGQLHKQGKVKPKAPHTDHSASGKDKITKFLDNMLRKNSSHNTK